MKDTRIEALCEYINDYYECDIRSKCRNSNHIEGRGIFIVLARREFDMKCSQLSSYLNMSESNIVRNHGLFLESIKSNKHIKRRFECISKDVLK